MIRALLRTVRHIAVTTAAGYAAFLVIIGGYAVLFSRETGFMLEGVVGGGILAFGVLLPAFVLLAAVEALRSAHEQAKATDEHVPSEPQPQREQEPPPRRGGGEGPEQRLDPHAVPPAGEQVPRHERHQQRRPADHPEHRRTIPDRGPMADEPLPVASHPRRGWGARASRSARAGAIGWVALVVLAAAWEAVALIDPADGFHSLSRVVNLIERVPPLQWLAFALWVVVGFRLLQPE